MALPEAYGTPCVRCGRPMLPGQRLDLDHVDGAGPGDYRGFAHAHCNRSAGASRGNRQRARKGQMMASTAAWLGIDTSNDRTSTAVVVARWGRSVTGAERLVTQMHRFAGPAPLAQVLDLYGDGGLEVAVDGVGHMQSFCDVLRGQGVRVLPLTAQDRAAATACLKDALNDRAVAVPRDPALAKAVQHAQERDLVGGSTLDKRRSPVDVAPLVALELAVWAAVRDRDAAYDPLDSVL
ncbi:hypothetical protein [Intrasporangium sp.]|uniref:hypothetical protein n=1 Tax=Intrasporangium sp. TaxID=1925024 RepID=UPI00322166AD